jgi:hypothetical protein
MSLAAAFGLQGWRVLFNNFAVEQANVTGTQVGVIQAFREIPGFLSLLVVYILLLVKEYRLSSYSIVVMGIGILLTGFFPSFYGLIITTLIMSFGFHYYETTNQSLTLQYFKLDEAPYVFGKIKGYASAINILVAVIVFGLSYWLSYKSIYILIGGLVFLVGMWGLTINPSDPAIPTQHKKMIFKKKYWLFYLLTFFAGARRQIFVVFALFLLVKIFHFTVQEVAVLFVLNNIIGYFLNPFLGKAIIRFGERKILSLEYFSLIIIFILYVNIHSKFIVAILYILDHIFFNFSFAIRTFFQKIGEKKDIAPSMAVGFTINHIAAVVIPVIGGILWSIDYKIAFYFGAFLSAISLGAVQFISGQIRLHAKEEQTP